MAYDFTVDLQNQSVAGLTLTFTGEWTQPALMTKEI